MRKIKGFTLIELLVVIAIIALLMSIVMPGLKRAKQAAQRTICMTNIKGLTTGIITYAISYKDQIPASGEGLNAAWNNEVYIVVGAFRPGWHSLGRLYDTGVVDDTTAFYCPGHKHPFMQKKYWDDTSYWERMKRGNPAGPGGKADGRIFTGYMYGVPGQVDSPPALEEDQEKLQFQTMSLTRLKNRTLVTDVFVPQFDPATSMLSPAWAHPGKGGALSAGFGDGSVTFVQVGARINEQAGKLIPTKDYKHENGIAGSGDTIDISDLFTACMFQLLAGRPHYYEKYDSLGRFPMSDKD